MDNNANSLNKNTFATAAMVMGILSFFLTSTIFIPLILGSLGVILAILSKEGNIYMNRQAKIGFTASLIGLISSLVLICSALYMYANDTEYRNEVNTMYERMYGMTIEEQLSGEKSLTPEEYMNQIYNMLNEEE